jgi:hypothetical protein
MTKLQIKNITLKIHEEYMDYTKHLIKTYPDMTNEQFEQYSIEYCQMKGWELEETA